MKESAGGWVKPFTFTDKERERLIKAGWQTSINRIKAESFIDSSEKIIKHWRASANDVQSIAKHRRYCASKIQKAAQELSRALNTSSADVNESIAAEMEERLYLSREYPEHVDAAESLKRATGNEHPGLYQMAEMLELWLNVLSEATGEVTAMKTPSGKNKGHEKLLIYNLANDYEPHFDKSPSDGDGTCFVNFCSELAEILNIELGEDIIKEVLAELSQNRGVSTQK